MEAEYIIQAISTVGFPIVACGGLFWLVNKISDQHKEEMSKVQEAISNNTLALTKLAERLGEKDE